MPNDRKTTLLLPLVYTAIFLAVLGVHARFWWPFYSDDALISLRYAARLLEGKGLNWNDTLPHVEGYSNLLWTLMVAFLGLFRVDLILASRALGFAGMGAVIFAVSRWQLGRACPRASIITLAIGLLFFTLSGPVAIWALGGLEQPLVAGLLALSLPLTFRLIDAEPAAPDSPDASGMRTTLALSLILGLLCITRPDGPIFSVAAFLSIIFGRLATRRPMPPFRLLFLVLPLFPVLLYGGQLAFRLAYYGEWVPNTALVKVSPAAVHFDDGLRYVFGGLASLLPFSALAGLSVIGCLFSSARRGRALALLINFLLWTPYVAYIGGDIHPAHRHLVALVVVFTFALVDGLDGLISWLETPAPSYALPRRIARIATPVLLMTALFPFVIVQSTHPKNLEVNEHAWVWNGEVTARLLKKAFGPQQPMVAVSAAGCIPYWSELPALDMLGLNDYYLPRHPPANVGEGFLGHELGDTRYVLDQSPDIVCFHTGIYRGLFYSGGDMMATPEFHDRYVPLRFLGREPRDFEATLWIERASRKIGIVRTGSEIRIPGYFFQDDAGAPVVLNASGKLVLPLKPGESASLTLDGVPDAGWSAGIVGGDSPAQAVQLEFANGALTIEFQAPGDRPLDLEAVILRRDESA